MADQAPPVAIEAPTQTSVVSAAAEPFDGTKWIAGLSAEQRAAVDDYAAFIRKPLESERHGLLTELGRFKKAADPVVIERLRDDERLLEQHRAAAVALYGVDAKDLADVDSVAALNVALRLLAKVSRPAPAAAQPKVPEGVPADDWQAYLSYKQQLGVPAALAGTGLQPIAPRGEAVEQVTEDNIDRLYLEGKVTDARYRQFRRTGQF